VRRWATPHAAAVAALAAALLAAAALPAASGAGEPGANAPPGAVVVPAGAPPRTPPGAAPGTPPGTPTGTPPTVIAITPEPPQPQAPPKAAARAGGARSGRGARAAGPPLSPAEVKAAQRRLAELGYWAGAASGPWDATWRHALIAFQKVEWRKPTGVLTRVEWQEMLRSTPPTPRENGPAHIEVDLARQVFFMVDDAGVVSHILPISTGSGRPFRAPGWQGVAETPCGHFTVFSRGSGWHHSQLGEMYNPLYIVGGIAIHGSLDVPPKPVSHGCIRIPMYASKRLPKLVPREMPVVVYGCKDDAQPAVVPAKR
jgi:L,D-transpeptidase catalytic domain/Putative peptidoglycan binding domain